MKVVAVLYPGGSAADNPDVLGCAENALGLREPLEEGEHELVSTTEREGEGLPQEPSSRKKHSTSGNLAESRSSCSPERTERDRQPFRQRTEG